MSAQISNEADDINDYLVLKYTVNTNLLRKSVALTLSCYKIENVLHGWQSHQEHRPHRRGDGNQQVARGQQQLLWYLNK